MVDIQELLKSKQGIQLDIGSGASKQPGFVGIDLLDLPEVDIVHNIELTPWPLPDECVIRATASHLLEHISPMPPDARFEPLVRLLIDKGVITEEEAANHKLLGNSGAVFLRVMDEIWRVLKPGGQFAFVVPYAESHGYAQDPTHCNMINETTMLYFDPLDPSGLYYFYKPKPWKIAFQAANRNGVLECLLEKRRDDPSYHDQRKPMDIVQEMSLTTQEVRTR